jgi:hypothetical protein
MAEVDTTATKKMAEDKKTLEAQNAVRAKQMEERAKNRGKPTPTQMECDLIKLGNHPELEPDGSQPDPYQAPKEERELHSSSGGGAGYSTRQASASEHRTAKSER